MESLNIDRTALFLIALELELPDLLSLCLSNTDINNRICRNTNFWLTKLRRDFSDEDIRDFDYMNEILNLKLTSKELYGLLYSLKVIKNLIKSDKKLLDIYRITDLNLSNKGLKTIPPAVFQLDNLKTLNLSDNQLTTLPEQLFTRSNLENLILSNNQLTEIPSDIEYLINLQNLSLVNNKLTSLPLEINKLPRLRAVNVRNNPIIVSSNQFPKILIIKSK